MAEESRTTCLAAEIRSVIPQVEKSCRNGLNINRHHQQLNLESQKINFHTNVCGK